jgi:hypothetical protein
MTLRQDEHFSSQLLWPVPTYRGHPDLFWSRLPHMQPCQWGEQVTQNKSVAPGYHNSDLMNVTRRGPLWFSEIVSLKSTLLYRSQSLHLMTHIALWIPFQMSPGGGDTCGYCPVIIYFICINFFCKSFLSEFHFLRFLLLESLNIR